MSQWFYTLNGQQQPSAVAWETLQTLAANGTLGPGEMVWTEGMAAWAPASTVENLFAMAPAVSPYAASGSLPYQSPAMPGSPYNHGYLPYSAQQAQFAGFWLRFCAVLIDGVLLWIVGAILQVLFTGTLVATQRTRIDPGIAITLQLLSILIGWLYSALQESSAAQATLGKRALGLKVTDMNGERISFGRASGRHFAKIISGIILAIGYIMAAFTEKKQALHDMMASTLVVKSN